MSSKLANVPQLTVREVEIWSLLSVGLRGQEIADQLKISAKTVDSHREHLRHKLKLKSTAHGPLMALGLRYGLARIEPMTELKNTHKLPVNDRVVRLNAVLFKEAWEKAGVSVRLTPRARQVAVQEIATVATLAPAASAASG